MILIQVMPDNVNYDFTVPNKTTNDYGIICGITDCYLEESGTITNKDIGKRVGKFYRLPSRDYEYYLVFIDDRLLDERNMVLWREQQLQSLKLLTES